MTLTAGKLEQPDSLRFLAASSWPSKDAAHYAKTRTKRRRLRDLPSKDPGDYAKGERSFSKWLEQAGPSKDPDDYRAREKTIAWLVTGPVRPPIAFYVLYAAAVATSIARAYVNEGTDAREYLLWVTIALFLISAFVLVAVHRHRWRKQHKAD